ncbi:MAG: zinc-dependent alcohol dehydrogenase family protein, partial [Bradymonadaceae bacterium]
RDVPRPAKGELLIKMKAASLNFRDLLMVQGMYNPRQALPLIPCSDGVGEVVELGAGVERFEPGERVMPIFAQKWISGRPTKEKLKSTLGGPLDGTLAEYMVLDAEAVVSVPEYLSDVEAAALPCAAVTAWNALAVQGDVKPGDRVLVLGTGGVAIAAVQIAITLGAEVIVTSSSDQKLERARDLGAKHGINYRDVSEWGKAVRALTDDVGVDHVIEVGGAGTLNQSIRAVRIGGHISLIGVLAGGMQEINVIPVLMQNIRVQGVIVGDREMFEDMNRAFSAHEIRPVIDRVFAFEEAPAAFEYILDAAHFGKVCITMD